MSRDNLTEDIVTSKKRLVISPLTSWMTLTLLIAFSWVYIFLRTMPMLNTDYEAFLFVGSRLAQGDRAYADVWDNKDPLTYWLSAFASSWAPISSHIVEVIWFVAISIATYFIARTFQLSPFVAALAGGVLGPLAILNLAYFQGATELPGVALVLVTLALAMRTKYLLCGITLGVLGFAKLIFLPLGALLVLFWVFRSRRLDSLKVISLGLSVTVVSLYGLMTIRGELSGYIETLKMNMLYSNAQLADGSSMPISDALAARVTLITEHQSAGTLLIIFLLLLAIYFPIFHGGSDKSKTMETAWYLTTIALVTSLSILFVTAKLPHHVLLTAVPTVLTSLLTLSVVRNYLLVKSDLTAATQDFITAGLTLGLSILATGVLAPLDHRFLAESGWNRMDIEFTRGASVDWLRENRQLQDTPIQFLGQGIPVPITGTDLGWRLGCRFYGQGSLSMESILNESLECLEQSQIVFVGKEPDFGAKGGVYAEFWARAVEKLGSEFECTVYLDVDVCLKNTLIN